MRTPCQGVIEHVMSAYTGGKDSATNVTFPVKLGPMAQLVLQFDSVQDQASVAGISVSGPLAPSFKLQSFLQNDTASPADSYGKSSFPLLASSW